MKILASGSTVLTFGSGAIKVDTSIEDAIINHAFLSSTAYVNDNVTTIGFGTFCSCNNLIGFSGKNVSYIRESAFYSCSNLAAVSCPNAVTIGSNAFTNCSSLTNIYFPEVQAIYAGAFSNCRALTGYLVFPKLGGFASGYMTNNIFSNCSNITGFEAPMFSGVLGSSAFNGCRALSYVDMPLVGTLSAWAFGNCLGLVEANFSNLTNMGANVFATCRALEVLRLPKYSRSLSSQFYDMPALKSLYLGTEESVMVPTSPYVFSPSVDRSELAIYVPSSLVAAYQSASYWSTYSSNFVGV